MPGQPFPPPAFLSAGHLGRSPTLRAGRLLSATGAPERQSENVWSPSILRFLSGHRWSRSVLCSQTGLQELGDSSEEKTGKKTFQLWIVSGLCCWSCFFWISWSCSLFLTVKTRQTSHHLTFYNVICVVWVSATTLVTVKDNVPPRVRKRANSFTTHTRRSTLLSLVFVRSCPTFNVTRCQPGD